MKAYPFIGVDGCKAGWFVIAIGATGDPDFTIVKTMRRLWGIARHAARVLIDIPIGLMTEAGCGRACDVAARKALAPRRHSSVFSPPCRQALFASSYSAACQINQTVCGRKISRQVWGIASKIREVDDFLQRMPEAKGVLRETHPEVCFWAMAGYSPMVHSKKHAAGEAERLDLLQRIYPRSQALFEAALNRYPRRMVARDDIIDALANAVTATCLISGGATLPENPPVDTRGLVMEMVYASPYRLGTDGHLEERCRSWDGN